MRSPTSSPSPAPARRSGSLVGTAVTIAALGTALSAAVFGVTGGGDSSGHTASHAGSPTAASSAAAGAHAMDGMDGMDGMQAGAAQGDPGAAQGGMPGMGSGGVELYAVQTGDLGVVATDGGGHLLYGSDGDATNPPVSHCTGTCVQEWQPLIVPAGQQPDLLGVAAAKVGRVTRDDGSSQLTLGGWPVYVNAHDDGQAKATAPDAHGAWFVLTPTGGKVQV